MSDLKLFPDLKEDILRYITENDTHGEVVDLILILVDYLASQGLFKIGVLPAVKLIKDVQDAADALLDTNGDLLTNDEQGILAERMNKFLSLSFEAFRAFGYDSFKLFNTVFKRNDLGSYLYCCGIRLDLLTNLTKIQGSSPTLYTDLLKVNIDVSTWFVPSAASDSVLKNHLV